jgi:MoxR-like ATPase
MMPASHKEPRMNLTDVATYGRSIVDALERVVVGKRPVLEQILTVILAGGHVLLEDNPGLAKTVIARSCATALGLGFRRIQFTPDLLPGDITGGYVLDRASGQFVLRRGPIFSNVVLADEINRASPRTQSALLEAMQEQQTTVDGETLALPEPFIVLATQNPIEYEGTFPLPEAQLDRFLVKLSVGYPSAADERELLRRRRERRSDDLPIEPVGDAATLLAARAAIEDVHVDADLEGYIVALVGATRRDARVAVGASPRGSLALLKLARVRAALAGRGYVIPDDIKAFVMPALAHRVLLVPDLWMQRRAVDEVLQGIVQSTAVPVVAGPAR